MVKTTEKILNARAASQFEGGALDGCAAIAPEPKIEQQINRHVMSLISRMMTESTFRRIRAEQEDRDRDENLRCADELNDMAQQLAAYSGEVTLDDYLSIVQSRENLPVLREIENELVESILFAACDPFFFYLYFVKEFDNRVEIEEERRLHELE